MPSLSEERFLLWVGDVKFGSKRKVITFSQTHIFTDTTRIPTAGAFWQSARQSTNIEHLPNLGTVLGAGKENKNILKALRFMNACFPFDHDSLALCSLQQAKIASTIYILSHEEYSATIGLATSPCLLDK